MDQGVKDDIQNIERIQKGQSLGLENLYDKYHRIVYGMVLKIVRTPSEAEDLLQDIFLQLWNKASHFDTERGSVYSWLMTSARNKALDRVRSKAYKVSRDAVVEDEKTAETGRMGVVEETPLDLHILEERKETVHSALKELPEEQRSILQLAYFDGLTQVEIAERLATPLGTVKTRMRLGMKKFTQILKGRLLNEGI